jgi:glycosyltransferase involved in cell wall biosynthesis
VLTIPNGVDLGRFAGVGGGRFRSRWGIDPGALVVATVGSIKPVKGQDVLLEAAIPWLQREQDAHLVLAGDRGGGFAEELVARAGEAGVGGRVHWPGAVEDVPGLLADADLFALPSRSEGMSNALLEAMAAGLAVVATDVGGNRECLDDGGCGMLVPAEDPSALGAALGALAADRDRRRGLGQRARARVERHYDLERILDRVEDLYRELLR